MRIQTLIKTVAAVGALALASAAQAVSVTYDLNNGGSAFTGGPWGTVTLNDTAANTVSVSVQLASGYNFVDTGAHEYFSFNLNGITMPPLALLPGATFLNPVSTNIALNTSPGSNSPFSSFDFAIVCASCSGNNTAGTTLNFSVSATGLSTASFNKRSSGSGTAAYFAADIYGASRVGGSNTTGVVGSNGPRVSVPEPTTLGLLGLGLAAVGFARRRKVAA